MMNAITKTQDRLLQVILAPQITEKATYIADKHQQIAFKVRTDATKQKLKRLLSLFSKLKCSQWLSSTWAVKLNVPASVWVNVTTGRKRM
jgi:hypothetical protein